MQTVTITLNQRVVSGHAGMTILEIAEESGIDIPTICHDPNLKSVGACRLCMVENEETGALLASCVTTVTPGMVINTNSTRVLEHRKMIVKMLLASHPDACLICDKGNRCRLRQIASDLGIGAIELERIPQFGVAAELNPFITRDTTKCVLCGKCIRACQEIVVEGVIDYYQRGFLTKPATLNDAPLEQSECTFCGTCIALCPTGALMEKEKPYQGTTSISVQTLCSYCGCGCPITLEIKNRHIVRALPAKGDYPNHGALCIRGSYGYDYIHSKERLTRPLIKENGQFRDASWEEALTVVSQGLSRSKNQHGPDTLALYGSSKCTNEENYLLQRFARTVLGTNNVDNGSSFHNSVIRAGLGGNIGFLSTTNLLEALEQAEMILVVGADPIVTAPKVGYAIKRAVRFREAKLILIEPRQTKLTFLANQWICPEPGSTLALISSITQAIIAEDLVNSEYINRQTEGFDELAKTLTDFSPETICKTTGVTADTIRNTARLYSGANKSVIVFGSEITGAYDGVEVIKALANLALLTNNIWGSGCGLYPLQKDNNAQGACEMGALPDFLPGYQSVIKPESRKRYESIWHKKIPENPGLNIFAAFNRGKEIPIKALYIVGENPICSINGKQQTVEALSSLDFLVVQDLFFTETAKFADVVLPAAGFAEKEGSFTNFEGRIGWLNQALPPLGHSLPDWEIILQVARAMDSPMPYSALQQVIDEIEEFVPLYEGYHHPEERLGEKWSYWEERRNLAFQSLTGFPRFIIPKFYPQSPKISVDYPYYLVLEAALPYFGSGGRSGKAWRLKSSYPPALLKIGRYDAEALAIHSGDKAKIITPAAQLTALVQIIDDHPAGTISLPTSVPNVLELFDKVPGQEEQIISQQTCYARIERVNDDG